MPVAAFTGVRFIKPAFIKIRYHAGFSSVNRTRREKTIKTICAPCFPACERLNDRLASPQPRNGRKPCRRKRTAPPASPAAAKRPATGAGKRSTVRFRPLRPRNARQSAPEKSKPPRPDWSRRFLGLRRLSEIKCRCMADKAPPDNTGTLPVKTGGYSGKCPYCLADFISFSINSKPLYWPMARGPRISVSTMNTFLFFTAPSACQTGFVSSSFILISLAFV